ncbi:MAG: LON peptidase substrate-binding domain-containing protein [Chloroflexota bacterium]|nr:LON peptidase substrate-binding domain-containing protein [Chloroflexota bacterium]
MVLNDVPLFPLDTVLFPQMILPLHIFEPRYRLMVSECLKHNRPFGVVLLQKGSSVLEIGTSEATRETVPYQVGTLARITEVVKLEDGRMLITTIGTERFRLLAYHRQMPYMTGDIEIWPDEASLDTPQIIDNLVFQVQAAFEAYLKVLMDLAGKQIEGLEIPADPLILSYLVPNWLQIGSEGKQRLLEISLTGERLREENQVLQRETEFLRRIKERAERETDETNVEDQSSSKTLSYDLEGRFSKN